MIFKGFKKDLIIREHVVDKFKKFEQPRNRNESGGILLGKVYSSFVSIEKMTTPSVFDRLGRYFFIRSKISAQNVINRTWSNSKGQAIYLGEWHTHSEINPRPSPQDRTMIENCLKTTTMKINFLFLIIVGLSGTFWAGVQTTTGLCQLTMSNESHK